LVLAVVFTAFVVGGANNRVAYQTRLQEKQVWSPFDVLLEAFVFAYLGLQKRFVVGGCRRRHRGLPPRRDFEPMIVPEAVVVSWPGIQAVTFTVAVGSLLLPEATLPAPIRRLHLPSDDTTRRDNDAQGLTAVRVASGRVVAEFARSPPPGIAPRCSSRSA